MRFKELVAKMDEVINYDIVVNIFYHQLKIGEMRVVNRHITPEQFLRLSKEERDDLEIEMTINTILSSTDDLIEWLEEKGFSGEELEQMKKDLELGNEMIKKDIMSLPETEKEGKRRMRGRKK